MASFNQVTLLGNLTRDPDVKYTPKGTAVCQIGIAVNRTYKNDRDEKVEEVTFIDIELWGRTAEIVGAYCKKGNPILIAGRLKLDTWDDKESGKKRSKLKVIGETVQLLGGKKDGESSQEEQPRQQQRKPAQPQPKPSDPDLDPDWPEDDIPSK